MKIEHVRVVALCPVVALQPEPPVAVAEIETPADGTKPASEAVEPRWLDAVTVVFTWKSEK